MHKIGLRYSGQGIIGDHEQQRFSNLPRLQRFHYG